MSSELRRQLREALGPEIKGLQRAVALEIADDARYDDEWRFDAARGRRSKVRLADLVRWTGAKNERVVRDALRSLSLAGWEFRLPIGVGADGRPMYAVPGVAMQYRVPDFRTPVAAPQQGTVTAGPMGPEGPVVAAQGPVTTAQGPAVTAEGPVVTGPPSPVLLLASPQDSPSSSGSLLPAGDEPVGQGGGGGDSSFEDQAAEALAASLDYLGTAPKPSQVATIRRRAAAALRAGWTEQELKACLDLKGDPKARDAAALYGHRLQPEQLPDLQAFREAARRPLEGTDAIVGGWMDLARPPGPHRPHQGPWRPEGGAAGSRPKGWEKWKHCGHPDCDEVTRRRDTTGHDGLPTTTPCTRCHPDMQF